jgi:hypothetical protein
MPEAADQAAVDIVADMMGIELEDEAPAEEAGEQPEAVAAPEEEAQEATEEEAEEVVEPVNFSPTVPEDLEEYLNAPDFEDDDAVEPEVEEEEEESEEYEDERYVKLKKQLASERKRREYAERLRMDAQRDKWAQEATKYFPLSEHLLDSITATSRRAFLREARKAHETVKPYVSEYIERAKKQATAAKEDAKAAGRQDAEKAWGKPLTGPGSVPLSASAKKEALENARNSGSLTKVVREMFKQGQQI